MRSPSEKSLLEGAGNLKQWIESQSIGVAAFRRNLPDEGGSRKLLGKYLEATLAPRPELSIVSRLPPAVLNLLLDIRPERLSPALRAHRRQWAQELDWLTTTTDGLSVVSASGLIADYILRGFCDSRNLLLLCYRLFGWHQQRFTRAEEAKFAISTAHALCVLRAPKTTEMWQEEKVQAVEDLVSGLRFPRVRRGRAHLRHIANAIYHRLFVWPLLVDAKSGVGSGISLPVAISALYDNRSDVRVIDTPFMRAQEWLTPLRNAVIAAKDLWIRAHRNYGSRVEEVRYASVVCDFRYASAIVEPFGAIHLGDESMGACFVQAVLGELLGKPIQMHSAVTGCVGPRPGYQLTWPSRIEQKLRYVFKSRFFEKIVLPGVNIPRQSRGL